MRVHGEGDSKKPNQFNFLLFFISKYNFQFPITFIYAIISSGVKPRSRWRCDHLNNQSIFIIVWPLAYMLNYYRHENNSIIVYQYI